MRHHPTLPTCSLCFKRRFVARLGRRDLAGLWMAWLLVMLTGCGQVVSGETPSVAPTVVVTPAMSLATVAPRPTVTLAQPTLAPPDTPTPSPTPIIHVVQPGETLIAIALQYGVTVAALQTANGISDPSTLQVSQELMVPTGEESRGESLELLLPTPTPASFEIEGLICREETMGSLWCLGEVVNSTESSIENVQLRVSLHDAAGAEMAGGDVSAALDLIPSGERAPFGVLFTSPPDKYDRFWARPLRAEASNEPASRYAALQVIPVEAGPTGSMFQVIGSVTNPGARDVEAVTVVVTTYDAEGQVTAFRQARLPDQLPAGASIDFAISLIPYDGVPASYAVTVQGRLTNP